MCKNTVFFFFFTLKLTVCCPHSLWFISQISPNVQNCIGSKQVTDAGLQRLMKCVILADVLCTFHISLEDAQNGESVDMSYLMSTFGNN